MLRALPVTEPREYKPLICIYNFSLNSVTQKLSTEAFDSASRKMHPTAQARSHLKTETVTWCQSPRWAEAEELALGDGKEAHASTNPHSAATAKARGCSGAEGSARTNSVLTAPALPGERRG